MMNGAYDAQQDIADRLAEYRASDEFKELRAQDVSVRLFKCIEKLMAIDSAATLSTLCFALEEFGAGSPQLVAIKESRRSDAEWWASIADSLEIEAYLAASLREIERRNFAPNLRKRVMLSLWSSLSGADQALFLSRVQQ